MPMTMLGSAASSRSLFRLPVVALLAAMTWGCGDSRSTTGPSEVGLTVRGRVLDFRSRAPVTGAAVQFTAAGSGSHAATTTAGGAYQLSLEGAGAFSLSINGAPAGTALVKGSSYRGDLFTDPFECAMRYGTLTDARTGRPVSRANVSAGTGNQATSAADGWYVLDFGCPGALRGLNTALMTVAHPDYQQRSVVLGRGVFYALRIDRDLEPR